MISMTIILLSTHLTLKTGRTKTTWLKYIIKELKSSSNGITYAGFFKKYRSRGYLEENIEIKAYVSQRNYTFIVFIMSPLMVFSLTLLNGTNFHTLSNRLRYFCIWWHLKAGDSLIQS